MSVIELRDVTVIFHPGTPDERVALNNLSLRLGDGEFTTVIGTNGAGKSTVLNVIAGVVKPQRGQVLVDGTDIVGWPIHRRARFISRVFQDPMLGTAPALSIEENLALAGRRGQRRGFRWAVSARSRERFREALVTFGLGLESRMSTAAGLLSGGQRQVLALIMATLTRPSLLLLDEHTAALDPRTAQLVMDATRRIVSDNKLSALMITHNMQHAIDYGDRLLMMEAGTVKLDVDGAEKTRLTVLEIVRRFGAASDDVLLQAAC
jgi:putative tryptophan/tyrosine transport system ATP-binding protein